MLTKVGCRAKSRLSAWAFKLAVAAPAMAAPQYCRLDRSPWLGCPTHAPPGGACGCPSASPAAPLPGRVRPQADEMVFDISSESTKRALGIRTVGGPVSVFVPRALIAHRDQAVTAGQHVALRTYDFFLQQTNAPPTAAGAAPPPPPPPPPAAPRPALIPLYHHARPGHAAPSPQLTPSRAFLRAADIPPPDVGAYGVVALKARATSASSARLNMLCHAYLSSLPAQQDLPASISISQQMVTIWPVQDPAAVGQGQKDCAVLLDHYDLYAGQSAIRDAQSQGQPMGGRGPFLIGWSPSSSRHIPDAVVLVIDMSAFDQQDSFDDALRFWQQKVVDDPALWRSGFTVERVRLAVRDFADRYGEDILKAIKIGD
jgi:hypothetical protein